MKIHFGYLLGFAALLIAGCAAFFSVYGIGQLFAGATTAVIVMASALEFGKLVAASYLQRYWKEINKLMRVYVVIGVIILIGITSGGIYGFLSSAYQQTYQKFAINQNEIEFLKQKETFFNDDVKRYDKELINISNNIATLSDAKATSIQVRDNNSSTGVRNTISTTGLRLSQERINVEEANRKEIMIRRNMASDSLQKYQTEILLKQNDSEITSELGPLVYISNLTGLSMDRVVNYFILILIFVFDPLAITLVIATNWVFQREKEKRNKKIVINEVGDKTLNTKELIKSSKINPPTENKLDGNVDELIRTSNDVENNDKPSEIIKNAEEIQEKKTENTNVSEQIPPTIINPNNIPKPNNKSQITNIGSGIKREEIKEIRQGLANRGFTKKIPTRRGH